jgi:hypothetical protein
MYFDSRDAIVMEQNAPDDAGRFGDSCAETSRYRLLMPRDEYNDSILQFRTDKGYVRHPEAPWREDDFSGDQALPMYLALRHDKYYEQINEFEQRIKAAGWRTGNGDLLALTWISVFYRAQGKQSSLTDFPILAQAIWLRFFSRTYRDGGADHLNFFHVLLQAKREGHTTASKLARWLMPHERFMTVIREYYSVEPNAFVVDAYQNNPI